MRFAIRIVISRPVISILIIDLKGSTDIVLLIFLGEFISSVIWRILIVLLIPIVHIFIIVFIFICISLFSIRLMILLRMIFIRIIKFRNYLIILSIIAQALYLEIFLVFNTFMLIWLSIFTMLALLSIFISQIICNIMSLRN